MRLKLDELEGGRSRRIRYWVSNASSPGSARSSNSRVEDIIPATLVAIKGCKCGYFNTAGWILHLFGRIALDLRLSAGLATATRSRSTAASK